MAKVTKTQIVIDIMKANLGKPMADLIPEIMSAADLSEKNAIQAYRLRVKADPSLGTIPEKSARVAKPKAEKTAKPKIQKVPAPRIAGEKEKPLVTDKTAEEIQDIKNKNLARLKAVGKKYLAGQVAEGKVGGFSKKEKAEALAYVAAVTDDLDSFKAPEFLTTDQVKALV